MATGIENALPGTAVAQEIQVLHFEQRQANLLQNLSADIAARGGPQATGAAWMACLAARRLRRVLSTAQARRIQAYVDGAMSALVFRGLNQITEALPPAALPTVSMLENRFDILALASRSQILLKLVDHHSFAYDIENHAKLVRLVANFRGGGQKKIGTESEIIELSSHAGVALGPHTEAPYWCTVTAENGHSPAPSALILTALWNPGMEATAVIPLPPVLEKIGVMDSLALTSRHFNFTRSDSFVTGKGSAGSAVSILDFKDKIGLTARFNAYRFSVDTLASAVVKKAYQRFCQAIEQSIPAETVLTQESAMLINNHRALHCRDIVKDNRRLLIRLFGLAAYSEPLIISTDPLLLQG